MNRLLKPDLLDLDPNSPTAAKEWKHWFRTFDNFIIECGTEPAPDKFRTIINLISHNVFDYVEDCADYDSVVVTLEGLYIKSPNEIFARHLLATRRQQPGESLDEFLQSLRKLSKDCNLKAVSAEQYREELLRNSFINGLYSSLIRQRLLENKTLSLQTAYDQANSLDLAQKMLNRIICLMGLRMLLPLHVNIQWLIQNFLHPLIKLNLSHLPWLLLYKKILLFLW